MATYQYSPLRDLQDYVGLHDSAKEGSLTVDGAWDIRLVRLRPNRVETAPVECELSHQRFSVAMGNYDALSYVWDDDTGIVATAQQPSQILVNGHAFPVTHNLQAALVRLRSSTKDRILWIDQICINQADVAERNSQVARMTFIYGTAASVVIWLGEQANESLQAMLLVVGLDRVWKLHRSGQRPTTTIIDISETAKWRALGVLLKRRWWQRTWVVQELAVSRDAQIVCGPALMPWSKLVSAIYSMSILAHEMPYHVGLVDRSQVISLERGRTRAGSRSKDGYGPLKDPSRLDTLLQALARYRTKQATDPRDKIYAILRLARDYRDSGSNGWVPIKVDYAKAVEEVYLETAQFLLSSEKPLEFLSHCRMTRNLPGLLSWVPDWSDTSTHPNPVVCHASPQEDPGGRPIVNGSTLAVQGSEIGRIDIVGSVCTSDDAVGGMSSQAFIQWRTLVTESFAKGDASQRASYSDEEFMRLITSAKQLDEVALADYASIYRQWSGVTHGSNAPDDRVSNNDAIRLADFLHVVRQTCLGRRLFISSQGAVGLAPKEAITGDSLVLFSGQSIPFALRGHCLVGACYSYDIKPKTMKGECRSTPPNAMTFYLS